jgi:HD-like signal output (HDOD) protein
MIHNLINKAIQEIPAFAEYVAQIEDQSKTPDKDLQDIELILQGHTSQQVYDFMPRFISLL